MAQTNATLIWKIADLRRGRYNPNQYREPSQSPEATVWLGSTANIWGGIFDEQPMARRDGSNSISVKQVPGYYLRKFLLL